MDFIHLETNMGTIGCQTFLTVLLRQSSFQRIFHFSTTKFAIVLCPAMDSFPYKKKYNGYLPAEYPFYKAMIAPFWADVDLGRGGTVWFRVTTENTIKQLATNDVKAYFPRSMDFQASWIFISTWQSVTFYGCSFGLGCLKRNTFQAVLISDGNHSIVMFNYGDIEWTTGPSSNGNIDTGLGGTPAQVGFNAGDGVRFFKVNVGLNPDVVNIDEMSNVWIPGVFVFGVDKTEVIQPCEVEQDLTVTPNCGTMLGGQYITLSAPCIDPKATIMASFSGSTKYMCERKSLFSIVCITPAFNTTGDIIIDVEIKDQDQTITRTLQYSYTVLNIADSKQRVFRQDPEDWFSGYHNISWDRDAAELQNNDTVDIYLFSLIEDTNGNLSWESQLLQEGVERSAEWTEIYLEGQKHVLAIMVTSATVKNDQPRRGIWSDVFPLALQQEEAYLSCVDWFKKDLKFPPLLRNRVQPCPCILDQALLDGVRFQPDPNCNMFSQQTGNCLYRKDAKHCVHLLSFGPNGMDNMCCYNNDNKLIDSRYGEGGTLQRYHYLGGQDVQPFIANFYFDVLPFLYCCRYSKHYLQGIKPKSSRFSSTCPRYIQRRQKNTCVHYKPPRPALTVGDPHLTTLDGYTFTFNGIGEFVYLKTNDDSFQSQIRFEQFRDKNGNFKDASVCTSFVSQHLSNSAVVEVRLDSTSIVQLLVNGDVLAFDETLSYHFKGVSVLQITPDINDSGATKKSHLISFTTIGIAFQTTASSNVLNIIPVVGNSSLTGHLRGLLGDFDGEQSNDLRTPSDNILQSTSTSEEIYQNFGLKWRITEEASLFTYKDVTTYSNYQNPSFIPAFETPTDLPADAVEVCGDDQECVFDYSVSGSPELAAETKERTRSFLSFLDAFELTVNEIQEEMHN